MSAVATPVTDLRSAVEDAVAALADGASPKAAPTLERPKQSGHGDYATNAAMLLAPVLRRPPRDVAADLGEELQGRLGPALERVEVAGPGFLNLVLADGWYAGALDAVLGAGEDFGGGGAAPPLHVNLEFVSANPTGPLHVGHARNAAYGDALARLLRFRGHRVHREYYVNDFGTQIVRFGESVQARARGQEPPDDGYVGAYIAEIAEQLEGAATLPAGEVGRRAVELMLQRLRASLHRFRVEFDEYFSERELHHVEAANRPSKVRHAFEVLEQQGRTYRHDGALWLRTTEFGDDKDRVLERSSGEHTYFGSDIAYQQDKRERGYDLLLYVWGADHHGYQGRMHAAWRALGGEPDGFELLIMQFVHLVERGERSSMSKRAGTFVTLDDLVMDIGVDAARWFLLQRSHDTTIDLDLDLAREQTNENPVFYVQYAHARIQSVLRKAGEERVAAALAAEAGPPPAGVSLHETERALVKKLLAWPDEVAEAADRRAPHRVATYALELAQVFTAFYRDCQVVGAEPRELEDLRLRLSVASRRTIARALGLLGVHAPDEM
jgi:arginyl-tRNA synthetase